MRRRSAVLLLLLATTGCGFFSRTKNTIYSLDRVAPAAARAAAAGAAPIGIDSIELPPDVDRREIVVRQANQKMDVRPNDLWAAEPRELVLHTLASDLAARLPDGMVILPGAVRPANMRAISVAFAELTAGPEPNITVDAQWGTTGAMHHERFTVPVNGLDSASVAAGMSAALAQLADRIAAGV